MKVVIYIAGIAGGVLLVLRVIGLMAEFPQNDLFLIAGAVLIGLVCIPLMVADKILHEKKVDRLAAKSKENRKKTVPEEDIPKPKKEKSSYTTTFPAHNTGMTWGGGNVHGANAKRGGKRRFLG